MFNKGDVVVAIRDTEYTIKPGEIGTIERIDTLGCYVVFESGPPIPITCTIGS